MNRNREWLWPLTGVAFFVVLIAGFTAVPQPKDAGHPVAQIVQYYVDHKSVLELTTFLSVLAGLLLVFYGAYLRKVLSAASGNDTLGTIALIGLSIIAIAFAIDATIQVALVDRADDINPAGVQTLQALYDDDFVPIALGVVVFLVATGIAAVQTAVLPKWLGWADGRLRSDLVHAVRLRVGGGGSAAGAGDRDRAVAEGAAWGGGGAGSARGSAGAGHRLKPGAPAVTSRR